MSMLLETPAELETPKIAYDVEPYFISEDGHFVGKDGFVVPKDFVEFFDRFPGYVRGFVLSRKWQQLRSRDHILDCEQNLLLYLMTLPAGSKYREQGKTDRIATFHPDNSYGASESRFFYYVYRMLHNHFVYIIRESKRDTLLNPVSLDSQVRQAEEAEIDSNRLEKLWEELVEAIRTNSSETEFIDRVYLSEFSSFVEKHNPELLPFMEVLVENPNTFDCRNSFQLSRLLFIRSRRRLRTLFECWSSAQEVPKQRKIYAPRRANKATPEPALSYCSQ